MAYTIEDAYESVNLTEFFDEKKLDKIGTDLCELVQSDKKSRSGWIDSQEEWLKLAAQVRETKSYPWANSSNVKYPLMTVACMQFHARALPGLLPNDRPVKAKVIGSDKSNKKMRRAERVSQFMSYQVMEQMEEWVDEFDRLLLVLPMIGLAYKKSYYSPSDKRMKSVLLLPTECVVNYHAKSYERARVTHILEMDPNEVVEMQRQGIFNDIELSEPEQRKADPTRDETLGMTRGEGGDDPYELYEVHHWLDLDDDGYKEPYIITIESTSKKVLRIVPRWESPNDVVRTDDNKIAKIKPTNYFTAFRFIPDPNSSVYGIGLGTLLGPTNEAVNTLINQLIDAGHMSTLQSGFLARGAKLKGGATRFRPGEWKIVNSSGDDLKKSIVPMPTRDPSSTLFNLMSFLVNAGERVSAVSDMMVGESPGQNQPATTTMAVLEQGLKVFNSIYKRIHRALGQEFKQLYRLNRRWLDENTYKTLLDVEIDMSQFKGQIPDEQTLMALKQRLAEEVRQATVENDFEAESMDVIPVSDPNMSSDSMKLLRANSLMEKLAAGIPLNQGEVVKRVLEAEGHDDVPALMTLPPPQPSVDERELDLKITKEMREAIDSRFDNLLKVAQAESLEEGEQVSRYSQIVNDMMKMVELKNATEAQKAAPSGDAGSGNSST